MKPTKQRDAVDAEDKGFRWPIELAFAFSATACMLFYLVAVGFLPKVPGMVGLPDAGNTYTPLLLLLMVGAMYVATLPGLMASKERAQTGKRLTAGQILRYRTYVATLCLAVVPLAYLGVVGILQNAGGFEWWRRYPLH